MSTREPVPMDVQDATVTARFAVEEASTRTSTSSTRQHIDVGGPG